MTDNHQFSIVRRVIWQAFHLLLVLIGFWLLFAGGLNTASSWLGRSWIPGDLTRRLLIFLSSFILFLRWGLTNFYLLKREMPWIEIIIVCIELILVHISFAVLGGQVARPPGFIEFIGAALFLTGSCLNTGSELMRAHWK